MPSRRAASVARSASLLIGTSFGSSEIESTAEQANLMLDTEDCGEMARPQQRVAHIFEGGEQVKCLFEFVPDMTRWFLAAHRGTDPRTRHL